MNKFTILVLANILACVYCYDNIIHESNINVTIGQNEIIVKIQNINMTDFNSTEFVAQFTDKINMQFGNQSMCLTTDNKMEIDMVPLSILILSCGIMILTIFIAVAIKFNNACKKNYAIE